MMECHHIFHQNDNLYCQANIYLHKNDCLNGGINSKLFKLQNSWGVALILQCALKKGPRSG